MDNLYFLEKFLYIYKKFNEMYMKNWEEIL